MSRTSPNPASPATADAFALRTASPATVAAIVVHHQGAADTIACVASIQEHAPGTLILVVDNGSTDGSSEALRTRLHGAEHIALVASGENHGFGAGCNLGIERALALAPALEHVLLLNPDVRLRPGTLTALRACAQHHGRAGIVGGRIVSADGDGFGAGARVGEFTVWAATPPPGGATEFETTFVAGCCMLVDAGLLRRDLAFDPTFFLYGEDADLCRRVHALGRSVWITQAATIERRRTGSLSQRGNAGARHYWITRARVLLARKHGTASQRLLLAANLLLAEPLRALLRPGRVAWLRDHVRGVLGGLLARLPTDRPIAPARAPGSPD